MKSKVIKIRNVPTFPAVQKTIHVKPNFLLFLIFSCGGFFVFVRSYLMVLGMCLIMISVFALAILPDRILAQFTSDYLILYNTRERDECTLVYWDEIVSWHYEYHANADLLVIILSDSSTVLSEMYSRFSIERYMNQYAAGKEVRTSERRKVEQ